MKKVGLAFILMLFLLALPALIWFFQSNEPFEVAIINKTAPDESYREHQSITWLLNHDQYVQNDGSRYNTHHDFYGFMPDESKESYSIRDLPDSYEDTDLIYVADTYGVYEEDLPWTEGTQEDNPGPPSLIYGGFEREEWDAVKSGVTEYETDLIMEFNSFASPTSSDVRDEITDFLRVEWQGWIGRHFNSLDPLSDEIPDWIISRYETHDNEWTYEGEGFILIHEFNDDIVVLSDEQKDLYDTSIRLLFTETGINQFGLPDSPPYPYWFDILEADHEEDVLAHYYWDLTDQGQAKLDKHDIPSTFPAVLHHQKDHSQIYYFAGDYADIAEVPRIYQYKGYAAIRSLISNGTFDPENNFFWKTYQPMMRTILADLSDSSEEDNTLGEPDAEVEQANLNGLSYPARVNDQKFEIYKNGDWNTFTFKGINIGMAKPGAFPGEAAISREEYDRWFEQIGEMHVNVIRNYTLHPPAFYESLYDYNQKADEPIYLLHGVWIDEEPLEETLDAFTPEIVDEFQHEMETIVDVIHGNATVEPEPGHASGTYSRDISPYVIGWVLGIEWYPNMVDQMLLDYPDLGDFSGDHVFTDNAAPIEHWMAQQFDHLMDYEMSEYSSMRPLSFTNWVTTDNLDQPAEPSMEEDMATVDPNHIQPKDHAEEVGMFASYHVYPYYPDFLNIEEDYTEFIDHRGEQNNYAGYLQDLHASHDIPILIAEFGIPASRGLTHRNPFGWNQGFISEYEQGEILTRLYEDIIEEEMLGGLIFTWQDEWFKRTWNTMDYDNPDRRPYWSNAQTNEQHFGLLSFDRIKVKVNGQDDWTDGQTITDKPNGRLTSLTVDHDERFLYLKSSIDDMDDTFWADHQFELFFSVRENEGIAVDWIDEGKLMNADFHLTIEDDTNADLKIAGNYDTFLYDYNEESVLTSEMALIDTTFHPIRLALSREQTRPDTGEILPFEYYEAGELRFGIGDPDHREYDSLSDYYYSEETGILEIRIPWMLLNARDPSQKEFIGDLWNGGTASSITVDGIDLFALISSDGETVDSSLSVERYAWDDWDIPEYEERLKESYFMIQELFSGMND